LLSVNRLTVKLPVTSFNVTDMFLYVMQFSVLALSHTLAHANKDVSTLDPDIPTPSNGSVPLVHLLEILLLSSVNELTDWLKNSTTSPSASDAADVPDHLPHIQPSFGTSL